MGPTLAYRIRTAASLAWDSILAHKLRSFLTLLGVVIGVASVILVSAAIEGLGVSAEQSTAKAFGSETYLVAQIAQVGNVSRKQLAQKLRYNKAIRFEDAEYLKQSTGDQILYSPYLQVIEDTKRDELTLEGTSVLGCAAALPEIRDVTVVDGRFFTEQEERNRAFVAVVGDEIRTMLFAGESPVGKTFKIRGYDFSIVGVQEKLGSAGGRNQDNAVYIPYPLWRKMFPTSRSITIFGRPRQDSGLSLDDGVDVTRAALRARYHTAIGKPDNFEFLTPDSIRSFVDNILGLIRVIVVPVTLMSLLVGGIVIMNIMLVSVTERTREIGVRKSLGARRSDILLQVLTESVMTSAAGGLLGILLGYGASEAITRLFGATMAVTLPYVILAVLISAGVGMVSGWYPAWRAARLDPIAALRQE
jgi:putative ABC transport system permease protein